MKILQENGLFPQQENTSENKPFEFSFGIKIIFLMRGLN